MFSQEKNNMERRTALTEEEKEKIAALSLVEASSRAIAGTAGRNKSVMQNRLKSSTQCEIKKCSGRPRKMTIAMTKRLKRAAIDKATSPNGLRQSLNLPICSSKMRRALSDYGKLKYKKETYAPMLTAEHKAKQMLRVRKYATWNAADWKKSYLH